MGSIQARVSQVLSLFCRGIPPPLDLVKRWLDHDESWVETGEDTLQDWVGMHLNHDLDWALTITVIEAAEAIAAEPRDVVRRPDGSPYPED